LKSKRCSRLKTGAADCAIFCGSVVEHDARRRLLEDLEQRIPRLAREHVRLVDDVDLVVIVARRCVHRSLAQFARVIDAAVRRRVDLDDVEARRAGPDARARRTFATGLALERRIAAALAVQRHREHASQSRLPNAARPAHEIPVRHAPARDRALQRRRHVRLHGDVGKALGAIFSGERERHERRGGRRKGIYRPEVTLRSGAAGVTGACVFRYPFSVVRNP
jgi:hypothetical protein